MSAPRVTKRQQAEQEYWENHPSIQRFYPKPEKKKPSVQRFYSFENGDGTTLYFKTRCDPDNNPLCFAALDSHETSPETAEELLLYGIKPKKIRVKKEKAPKEPKKPVDEATKLKNQLKMAKVRAARKPKVVTTVPKRPLVFSDDEDE